MYAHCKNKNINCYIWLLHVQLRDYPYFKNFTRLQVCFSSVQAVVFSLAVMTEALFGVLLDVSGSMESAYIVDRSTDANVERTHAILSTIMNIVKREVVHHGQRKSIFACAFGLQRDPIVTCDLLSLLEYFAFPRSGYQALIDLAVQHGAPQAEPWVRKYLSELEARIVYSRLCSDTTLIRKLIELIPLSEATSAKTSAALSSLTPGKVVRESRAYEFVHDIINKGLPLEKMKQLSPRTVQHVSEMLDDLLQRNASSSQSLQDRIQELLEPIKPYIFGETPMCKALEDAETVFKMTNATQKALFLLSDGVATDNNPVPIARRLHDLGVTIATCFLAPDHIMLGNPRCLFYQPDPSWKSEDGRLVLLKMSSTVQNTAISYLVDVNWKLPTSGVSRLFIQTKSLDVVNEFCEVAVSQMTESCDVLVDLLEKVDLATYINQRYAEFEPKEQEGSTCYANAIAAVFHLAMHRIVGREGGIPDFYKIRERIIREYGIQGANTKKVLENICPEYRLHFHEVDETGARQAINKRRPVIARFSLHDEQWNKFSAFYQKTPKEILKKHNVTGEF